MQLNSKKRVSKRARTTLQFVEATLRKAPTTTKRILEKMEDEKIETSKFLVYQALRQLPVTTKRVKFGTREQYVHTLNPVKNDRQIKARFQLATDLRKLAEIVKEYADFYPDYEAPLTHLIDALKNRGPLHAAAMRPPRVLPEETLAQFIERRLSEGDCA